jgi:ribosomal protein S18 acetylase RimI-like enzyme
VDVTVEIRTARPSDVEGVCAVAESAWHAAHAPIIGTETTEEFLDEYYDAATFRANVEDEETIFDVAVADEVVGFVTVRPAVERDGTFALGRIYVTPDAWGEGIGGKLLDHTERAVGRRGGTRVELGVMAENDRAIGFYESAGYERVDGFYDERIDARGYNYAKEVA